MDAFGQRGGQSPKSRKLRSVIEEAHLDTMFPSGPGGSEPSESKEAKAIPVVSV